MEYTIKEMAQLAGISTRTLRYYDQIGLLPPSGITRSGYRIYSEKEVDALQQILLYKAMGMELAQIRETLTSPQFDHLTAMEEHLQSLLAKKQQIEIMIRNVTKTIEKEKGVTPMTDEEKFEGLKQELIKENDKKYGKEIRQLYGAETMEKSNAKLKGLTQREYDDMEAVGAEIYRRLGAAVKNGNLPEGAEGRKIAELHKKWLSFTWPVYSRDAHRGLVEMYTADERFKAYYDSEVPGCAKFLKAAVKAHI